MCGIVGKLNFNHDAVVSSAAIEAMLSPMAHRGPDGHGVYVKDNVGLGHCRLSIIDVGGGHQPMCNEDGTVWITFNGEIYNYLDLRTLLLGKGHIFKSRCDTEVIVHLYEEYGARCVEHLRGMFAFAIWDERAKSLFVARDRLGIKPLYYAATPKSLLFGSELKSLLVEADVSRELSPAALRQYFAFNYLPGEATLFASIHKLLPGHALTAAGGKITTRQYWDLEFPAQRTDCSFDDAVGNLQALLRSTVQDHMMADVPVGVLLSGGVDSTAILGLAAEGARDRLKTFTVGFSTPGIVDERPYARIAAQKFGSEHHEITISAEDFWAFLPAYAWHMEEPVCEPPAVALYYVSKLARPHVKVLLSGEGGDEAFAGYPNYPHTLSVARKTRVLGPTARPIGATIGAAAGLLGMTRVHRYARTLGRPLHQTYFSRTSSPTSYFNRNAARLFDARFRQEAAAARPQDTVRRLLSRMDGASLLDQMLYVDTKTWLPDDLLVKADKITMANSLELRVPLLDHKVLEFAASLPDSYKVRGNETKRVLKAAFSTSIPNEILTRKKTGFPVPYSRWLGGELGGRTREVLLSNSAFNRTFMAKAEVSHLVDRHLATASHGKEVFSLLALEFWAQQFGVTA